MGLMIMRKASEANREWEVEIRFELPHEIGRNAMNEVS